MKDDEYRFLSLLGRAPARLTAEQTACVFNCAAHDIPVLIAARLLKPLGSPAPNGVKYFATDEVLELAVDRSWLSKMTQTVQQYWRRNNHRRPQRTTRFSSDSRGFNGARRSLARR